MVVLFATQMGSLGASAFAPLSGLPSGVALVQFFCVCATDNNLFVATWQPFCAFTKTWLQMG